MADESQIATFYNNRKILVTGGTGYMGKVLIWKLLHSCPNLDVIYVLIRSKYGKGAMSRKETIFGSRIFENFKKNNPKILEKVVFISGDVGEEKLGLSDADRNMLIDEVSIIFHSAAILKMDANLRTAVNVNTVGTLRMLELAMEMKNLDAFVYNSTIYCCCENLTVEEKIYPAKHNPHDIINLTHWMEPELLEKITPQLIYPLPNTYIYSKRLTEFLLPEYASKVPIIVARPSTVIPASVEPLPGWNDNLNGPGGFFVTGGKGLLRTTMMKKHGKTNVIPVDVAINAIVAAPWANPKEKLMNEISVYNVSQTGHEDLTWGKMVIMAVKGFEKYPFEKILWYPSSDPFTDYIFIYTIKCIFLHYLPAYVIDFILMLMGEKPFMVRAHNTLRQADGILKYFTLKQWNFLNHNLLGLEKQMNNVDKKNFLVSMKSIDMQEFMDNAVYGSKVYIFNEDMKNMPSARRLANIMFVADKLATVFKYYVVWRIFIFLYSMLFSVMELYRHLDQY